VNAIALNSSRSNSDIRKGKWSVAKRGVGYITLDQKAATLITKSDAEALRSDWEIVQTDLKLALAKLYEDQS
jgi:hypothetical protein